LIGKRQALDVMRNVIDSFFKWKFLNNFLIDCVTYSAKISLMHTLQIEHDIPNYEGWKNAFDSDPINRKQSGVKSYRIYQPKDNSKFVRIELDFENIDQLNTTFQSLQNLWNKVQGSVMSNPKTTIFELIESKNI
jgi:hypothetical protein